MYMCTHTHGCDRAYVGTCTCTDVHVYVHVNSRQPGYQWMCAHVHVHVHVYTGMNVILYYCRIHGCWLTWDMANFSIAVSTTLTCRDVWTHTESTQTYTLLMYSVHYVHVHVYMYLYTYMHMCMWCYSEDSPPECGYKVYMFTMYMYMWR